MKHIVSICQILFFQFMALVSIAQTKEPFQLNRHSDNISFVTMDSTHSSQTTVIEYPNFLVLIELPFVDLGADKSTDLYEDVEMAERFITYTKSKFKNKPIKYVLSTHWHLHSLSAITPFFNQGAKLVAAESNWKYSVDHNFLGKIDPKSVSNKIVKINRDTVLLSKSNYPIDIIFLDSTYTHKPTKDYLFFYFPKSETLHASCMCALSDVDFEKRKNFIYSDRITDLNNAIASRRLKVKNIIKLGRFEQQQPGQYLQPVFTQKYLNEFTRNGKPMHLVVKEYTDLSLSTLQMDRDSILQVAIEKKISPQVFNQAVYNSLKMNDYRKAVAFAQLLNLYKPGEVNYIDTLGEAYFAAGEAAMAAYYQDILLKIDPEHNDRMKNWEQNKKNNNY